MFPAEPIPDLIGTYKVVRRLASTGTVEVYLARSQGPMGFARECELKLMPDTSEGNTGFAQELAREAAICAKLNHPAVVRVFDFFEHQGKLVLALEHVDGTSLAQLINYLAEKHQKLADAAVYYIGARIAGALADAHAARDEQGNATPIVHRNLSPDTVLIGVDGEVRLTGFGIGKILGRTPDTAIGMVKGTPGYMAPEQSRGEPVTTKADVYGLGVLLWSLLSGRRPPTDGTWPRRISGIRNDLPKEVAALVDAALDHFPGTRKISAREMEQWLTKAAPPAKGKTELHDRVAAMRADDDATQERPPPSSRRRIASSSSGSLQSVRFGPAPQGAPAARLPSPGRTGTLRGPDLEPTPPKPAGEAPRGDPVRTATGDNLPRVALNLPPPPPPAAAPVESATASRAAPRFGAPLDATPTPAPPTQPREGPTMPSRQLTPAFAPTAAIPAVPNAPPPAPTPPPAPAAAPPPAPTPPPAPAAAPPPAPAAAPPPAPAPIQKALLAPVLPLPATPAPRAGETTSSSIRFGAPPAAPSGPVSVQQGPVFSSPFGTPSPAPAAAAPGPSPFTTPEPPLVPAPPTPPVFAPAPPTAAPPPVPFPLPEPMRRRPMPSILTIRPGKRTLSALGAVVVSALTATVVVSLALYWFIKRDKGTPAPSGSASALRAASAAPVTSVAAPVPSVTASANASPADLSYGYGYLTVVSPANANVYVSGKLAGPVNKPLKVRCGRWFIRLAAPDGGRYPEWVSGGETVVVACQDSTRLEMGPHKP